MSNSRHEPTAPTDVRRLTPGGTIPSHRHDDHQIIYAGRGVVAVTTEFGEWIAPGSQAIWVPGGTVHSHRTHGELELHLIGIPTVESIPPWLHQPGAIAVSPLMRELIRALTDREDVSHPAYDRMRDVLVDQVLEGQGQALHVPLPTLPPLRDLSAIFQRDPGDRRTLAELAVVTHTGERTLSRSFQSELGMTFPEWRTRLRLAAALVLLADGLSVTVVAHRCGWSSASAFIDVFRRRFGHTPGLLQR